MKASPALYGYLWCAVASLFSATATFLLKKSSGYSSFAEIAKLGWLASAAGRAWIHPRDLALAEAGLLGDCIAAAMGGHLAAALPATTGASISGHGAGQTGT